jgi:hypothetical protein
MKKIRNSERRRFAFERVEILVAGAGLPHSRNLMGLKQCPDVRINRELW